ncbi:CMRF35-like molecule 5 [Rhineura floridana]|uniref:CMRF35-like molecule 5 n=1 Tax=Rhineura floridana TaxID=261503 RepID=UPI002AC827B2|nr:CMRF35-like molecule 5 [Rhineura floridana]
MPKHCEATLSFLGDFGYRLVPASLSREESRTMRLFKTLSLLGWLLFLGCASVLTGPKALSGFLGRSLSVMCQYDAGYLDYHKYWCKGTFWSDCHVVVETRGSEAEVKASRTSIKDNQARLEFTVSLRNLTQQDAGGYWCGIAKAGVDLGFPVDITVLPAPSSDAEEKIAVTKQPGPDPHTNTAGKEKLSSNLTPTKYLIYVPFLVSIIFKVLIFLCLVFAIIWMHRRHHQASASAATL